MITNEKSTTHVAVCRLWYTSDNGPHADDGFDNPRDQNNPGSLSATNGLRQCKVGFHSTSRHCLSQMSLLACHRCLRWIVTDVSVGLS